MGIYVCIERALAGSAAYGHGEDVRTACGVVRESKAETINTLIHSACEGLSITGEQLYTECEEGDLPDTQSGTLTHTVLRLTAATLALMRASTASGQVTQPTQPTGPSCSV
jgi:hypothetical protein